jgi:hypothetical protein
LDFAESEGRIVLTLAKNFWQIAVQRRPLKQSDIVLFRAPLVRARADASDVSAGHLSIVTPEGIQTMAP